MVVSNLLLVIAFAGMRYAGTDVLAMMPSLLTSSVIAVAYLFMMIMLFLGEDQV